jgi:hypothetical protein
LSSKLPVEPLKIILGESFGSVNNYFDPGKMGSYFQSPQQVQQNMQLIQNIVIKEPKLAERLADLLAMFQQAIDLQQGLYITF